MKKIYLLLLLPFLSSCYEQQRNCTDFKMGRFSFTTDINGKKKTTIFERKNDIEIETYEGQTDTSMVRWVSDCEYILQKKNPKNMQEKKAITMKILTTSKNSYTFEYGLVGSDLRQKGTVTKLN
jgi:hypothetical protein